MNSIYVVCLDFKVSKKLRFVKSNLDHGIFISLGKSKFISVLVNNFLVIDEDLNIINSFKNKLSKRFCITNVESVYQHLRIPITWTKKSVSFDQRSYLENSFSQFGIDTYKLTSSPIDSRVLNFILPTMENY